MKKFLVIFLALIISTIGLALNSYAQPKPQHGGILRIITPASHATFYMVEGGPQDLSAMFPGAEALMQYTARNELTPHLAKSVDIDEKNLTITFHLRNGIKFHDGSDLDAENVAWSFNFMKEKKRLQYGDKLKSVEILDDYTVRLHLTEYNNMLIHSFGWHYPLPKKVYTTKDKDWLRSNFVGTGPFKLVEWKRDSHIKWERNKDYWQKGRPYLNGLEFRYIPDPVTASSMMQAKEADMWTGAPVKDQADLEKKGFIRRYGYCAFPAIIYPNTSDPNRPTGKQKVREAIEYGLDKAAIARALGFGYYSPMKMVAPEGDWGYDPNYPGRPYDPEKAKKLLAEAGYPNGLKLKLLVFVPWAGGNQASAEAIKAYLSEVGINIDIDIADPGRYFGSIWGTGWEDLSLGITGLDPTYLVTFQRWFSHDPATNLVSFKRSPELIVLSKESITYSKEADQIAVTKKLVRLMADEACMIPLWKAPTAYMVQPYVHSTYLDAGVIAWSIFDDWMEKH
jgi:peptide/nickel transport system substrate-binding protein